jgi:hypothetical protein
MFRQKAIRNCVLTRHQTTQVSFTLLFGNEKYDSIPIRKGHKNSQCITCITEYFFDNKFYLMCFNSRIRSLGLHDFSKVLTQIKKNFLHKISI